MFTGQQTSASNASNFDGNIDPSSVAERITPRTRAIILAHTLGNPFDLDAITAFCRKHNLWLIEDNCDALGSTYSTAGGGAAQLTGTFGDLSTQS